MFTLHEYLHDSYGICLWLVLTIILAAAMLVVLVSHLIRQKRRDDRAKQEREEMAGQGVAVATPADGR